MTFTTRIYNEKTVDFNLDGKADKIDLNGSGELEENAQVWLLILTTNKNVSSLIRMPNSPTNH